MRVYVTRGEDEEVSLLGQLLPDLVKFAVFSSHSCCQCLHQGMLSLWCSVTKTPSPSLSTSTTELTPLIVTSSVLLSPIKRHFSSSFVPFSLMRMRSNHVWRKMGVAKLAPCFWGVEKQTANELFGGVFFRPSEFSPYS